MPHFIPKAIIISPLFLFPPHHQLMMVAVFLAGSKYLHIVLNEYVGKIILMVGCHHIQPTKGWVLWAENCKNESKRAGKCQSIYPLGHLAFLLIVQSG